MSRDRPRVILDNLPEHCYMIETGTTAGAPKPGRRSRNWRDVCYVIECEIHRRKIIAIVDHASYSAAKQSPLRPALSSYRFRADYPTLLLWTVVLRKCAIAVAVPTKSRWPRFALSSRLNFVFQLAGQPAGDSRPSGRVESFSAGRRPPTIQPTLYCARRFATSRVPFCPHTADARGGGNGDC